jgi:hypothetical protein
MSTEFLKVDVKEAVLLVEIVKNFQKTVYVEFRNCNYSTRNTIFSSTQLSLSGVSLSVLKI